MGDSEQQQRDHPQEQHQQQRVILKWLVSSPKWRAVAALGLGQVVSLLVTATGFTSSFLAREGVHAPTAQAFCNYALLAIVCGSIVLIKRPKIKVPWYAFLLLAVVDVEANFLGGSNVVLGDFLVIGASMLYAISNVSEIGPFVGFALAQFSFYLLVPILLQGSGSAMFNLSLLTSDMWAVAIRALAYHEVVDWLYFVAFGTVAIGLSLYSYFGEPRPKKQQAAAELDEPGLEEIVAEHPVKEDSGGFKPGRDLPRFISKRSVYSWVREARKITGSLKES
ncbi:hypothetical protein SELMODRAFT_402782 [Selaginella moellendorffii]|uniref:EamA domain-containing protein n=1 Tax=Selaginella moellendorffii TaxID=88036 RepID=D8QN13_SELML|nr:hypothetical protein SELMODRAFT_402782 [Selaginella moellendorffii]